MKRYLLALCCAGTVGWVGAQTITPDLTLTLNGQLQYEEDYPSPPELFLKLERGTRAVGRINVNSTVNGTLNAATFENVSRGSLADWFRDTQNGTCDNSGLKVQDATTLQISDLHFTHDGKSYYVRAGSVKRNSDGSETYINRLFMWANRASSLTGTQKCGAVTVRYDLNFKPGWNTFEWVYTRERSTSSWSNEEYRNAQPVKTYTGTWLVYEDL